MQSTIAASALTGKPSKNLKNFRFKTGAVDGIAVIAWDMPSHPLNVINPEVLG